MFLKTDAFVASTASAQPNNPSGVSYYAIPYSVTSGSSAQTSSYVNLSDYNNVWIQARISGSSGQMAGTGSLYITSVSELDAFVVGGSNDKPLSSSLTKIAEWDMANASWVTSSATFTARWGQFVFTPTSASSGATGSLLVKASLSNIKP